MTTRAFGIWYWPSALRRSEDGRSGGGRLVEAVIKAVHETTEGTRLQVVAENVLEIVGYGADALWHDRKKNKCGENDQVHDSLQHRGASCPQRNYADEKR